jgi:hypothetical protein
MPLLGIWSPVHARYLKTLHNPLTTILAFSRNKALFVGLVVLSSDVSKLFLLSELANYFTYPFIPTCFSKDRIAKQFVDFP